MKSPVHFAFSAALEALVAQIKTDSAVLAVILCGSLSHDTVWARSDIDLVLITTDDKLTNRPHLTLNADGINVHALLMPRTQFRKLVEGSLHQSFAHSLLAKGRLLYTDDDGIAELCARLSEIGSRDTSLQLLRAGIEVLAPLYKAHKWFLTRGDYDYTALWLLYAATSFAKIEVLSAGQLLDREVILTAARINPAFFGTVYTDLLNKPKTRTSIRHALAAADGYLVDRTRLLFSQVLDYLEEAGETRSASEIEAHFLRNRGIDGVTIACEYLADQKLIGKASLPARATRKSTTMLQELAFFHIAVSDDWEPDLGPANPARTRTAGQRKSRGR